jgi:poly-beta-1,6-N-acetyl-D-glucosamine synthase
MKNRKIEKSVAVIVPAHNEESVLAISLKSILKIIESYDLYVVDDGSNDNTAKIAKKYTKNVISIANHGKAYALNYAINKYKLTKRYNYILFMDADTKPDANYLKYALPHFEKDKEQKLVCVVGRVKGDSGNWISRYRQWEYQISHLIHKRAQQLIKCILVVPGCATIYRSFIFDELSFPTGTMTEDMDFTFQMHRNGFSNIIFENKSVVYTQDPQNIKDYISQLKRWYTGFWQVVKRHDIPWQGQLLDLEVTMLAIEGLYNGLLVMFLLFSFLPIYLFWDISIFRLPFLIDLFVFFIPTLLWSSLSDKDYKRILYLPHYYFLRFLSSAIFLMSFFRGFVSTEKNYMWNTNRYLIRKEEI